MIPNLNEVRMQAAAMFIYFSAFLKKDVMSADGIVIGRVWDAAAKLGEVYPKIDELILSRGIFKKTYVGISWADVVSVDDDIVLKIRKDEVRFSPDMKAYEFLLKRDVLDQQVVDTFNHKVRRVNDIQLLKVERDFVIAHVDIGLRGLVRRLDIEHLIDFMVRLVNKNSPYFKPENLISWKYVQPISLNASGMTMKLAFPQKQLMSIPAADLGEMIFDLTPNQRIALFRGLDIKTKAKVFESLEFEEQRVILKELDKKEVAQLVTHMSADEATDLLEKLPSSTVKNLLILVESTRAKKLSMLLGYSSDSAGGLMTTEFVSLPETMLVGAAIEHIKNNTKEVDTVPYLYIVDEKNHLKGATTIRRLLFADPADNICKTMFPKTLHVHLHDGMKEVAYLMDKYKISAIPVVDEEKVLNGLITMDDVLSQVISLAWRKRSRVDRGI